MPVPGGELEAEMLGRGEMAEIDANETDGQKDRADDDVGAVKSGRHEEGRAIDVAAEIEARMHVLIGLHAGERGPQRDGEDEAPFDGIAVVLEERVMRP